MFVSYVRIIKYFTNVILSVFYFRLNPFTIGVSVGYALASYYCIVSVYTPMQYLIPSHFNTVFLHLKLKYIYKIEHYYFINSLL